MARSVNNDMLRCMYIDQKKSIPQIADILHIPRSAARKALIDAGVVLRSRADGIRAARDRLGIHMIGKKRVFTEEHRAAIREGSIRRAEISAAGISRKPNGYLEYTRGEHKGRSVHVVKMEARIGRHILPDEHVHHIDGDKENNDINNLALVTRSGHMRLHRRERKLCLGNN